MPSVDQVLRRQITALLIVADHIIEFRLIFESSSYQYKRNAIFLEEPYIVGSALGWTDDDRIDILAYCRIDRPLFHLVFVLGVNDKYGVVMPAGRLLDFRHH